MTSSFRFHFTALLCLLLAGLSAPAAAQRAVWGTLINNAFLDTNGGSPTATDADGNTYIAGVFSGTLRLGGQTITAAPRDVDVFVAKLDSLGRLQWLQSASGLTDADTINGSLFTFGDRALNIGLSPDGQHLYLAGIGGRDFHFGSFQLDSASEWLTKLDVATGAPLWLRPLGAHSRYSFTIAVRGLAADNAGNGYLTAIGGRDTLGNLPLGGTVGNCRPRYMIAKCSPAGQFLWVNQIYERWHYSFLPNHQRNVQFDDLAVDALGSVTVSGSYWGSFQFGAANAADSLATVATDTTSTPRALIVRYTPAGAVQWMRPGTALGIGYRMAGDAAGNAYISYFANGPASAPGTFAGLTLAPRQNYFLKVNAQGVGQWATPVSNGGRVAVDRRGQAYLSGGLYGRGTFGAWTLVGGPTGWQPFVAAFDAAGGVRWARTSTPIASAHVTYAQGMGVGVDRRGRVYQVGVIYADRGQQSGTVDIDGQVVKGIGTFLYRFDEAARITGSVYLDANGNGARDATETAFPRPVGVAESSRPFMAFSSPATSAFTIFADTGAYQVGALLPDYYTLTQGATGYGGHLRTYGQLDTARTFGLVPVANRPDIRVTITPYSAARPGRATHYRAHLENVGTTVAAGTLTVHLDAAARFTGAQPAPAAQTGQTLAWNYTALAPFQTRDYTIAASLVTNVTAGTRLLTTASAPLAGDLTPATNVDSARQIVTNSFDPNDLTVNYTTLTPAQVAAGQVLDYVIQFQNLGTDTAFSVVIHDSLPARLLRLGTLALVAQSHNVTWMLDGDGHLQLNFPGIQLPHRAVDALRSMGFVRFQVKPSAALLPGALIPNTAHIVFDYNVPLATNQVTTLVQAPNGLVAEAGAADASMRLYPNPATEATTLTAHLPTAGTVAVVIADALGRSVRRETTDAPAGPWAYRVPTTSLVPGVYVVRLMLPGAAAISRRLVVQ